MKTRKANDTLAGLAISPGLAMGVAYIYRDILQRGVEHFSIREADAGHN